MKRPDMSPYVIHFTKGDCFDDAFERFLKIVRERRLLGSSGFIKGEYNCVCFTEAPLSSVVDGLGNFKFNVRYSPFGFMFEKKYIFREGGRPVIYQPDYEFLHLPETHRWRHVTYNPDSENPVDWTWQREWRMKTDEFYFDPQTASLVVPNEDYAKRLQECHERNQDLMVLEYSQIMCEELAVQYREDFLWNVVVLNQ